MHCDEFDLGVDLSLNDYIEDLMTNHRYSRKKAKEEASKSFVGTRVIGNPLIIMFGDNGLLLIAYLHRLLDSGEMTINPDPLAVLQLPQIISGKIGGISISCFSCELASISANAACNILLTSCFTITMSWPNISTKGSQSKQPITGCLSPR